MKAVLPFLLLAGCASRSSEPPPIDLTSGGSFGGDPPGASSGGVAGGEPSGTGSGAITGGAGAAGAGTAAERPYAHVRAVSVSGEPGAYQFSVTVESQDVDCSQFANWWEVLTLDGELIYRRILQHSHTDENGTSDADAPGNSFTRSGGPVAALAEQVVVVRAHMNTGGYHGDVLVGPVAGDFSVSTTIGDDFAPDLEQVEPQPTGCDF